MPSRTLAVVLALAVAAVALAAFSLGATQPDERAERPRRERLAEPPHPIRERPKTARPSIHWRRSRALGAPAAGRLAGGVRLPASGRHFATWDPVLRRSPDRAWRRWGTDRLVRLLLRVAREHRSAHPEAPRVLIGDLSRPRGGDFGVRFGRPGHASHQNGLDADLYYSRRDRGERAPLRAAEIDRRLSQDLVDRFVRAGAETVFVGPGTGLTGPAGVVKAIPKHDNHLHVRIR
jgi:murein endopeptidase